MNSYGNRKQFLKKLYYSAGRSINDETYKYVRHYVDYKYLNRLFNSIVDTEQNTELVINDCFGAFFNVLCRRLVNEIHYNQTVILVQDPYFSEKNICQMYIIDKNISIINKDTHLFTCKANSLYASDSCEKSLKNRLIALEFFKNAYKYN